MTVPLIDLRQKSPLVAGLEQALASTRQGLQENFQQQQLQQALGGIDYSNPQSILQAVATAPSGLRPELTKLLAAQTAAMQPKQEKQPLTLNEQINQVRNRQKEDIEQLLRPYMILDPITKMMAFHSNVGEERKQQLMDTAQKIIDRGRRAISTLYQRNNLAVPEDLDDFVTSALPDGMQGALGEPGRKETGEISLDEAIAKGQKTKWDPTNPTHQEYARQAQAKAKGNTQKANKILNQLFVL